METREELLNSVKGLLFGPDPLDKKEEVLYNDSPLKTYVTGILFPQVIDDGSPTQCEEAGDCVYTENESDSNYVSTNDSAISYSNIAEPEIESEIAKINNYKQSAMGITVSIPNTATAINIQTSVGYYSIKKSKYPEEKRDPDGKREVKVSESEKTCYYRKQYSVSLALERKDLPTSSNKHLLYKFYENNVPIDGLEASITFRLTLGGDSIFTITLLNTKKTKEKNSIPVESCWFQCSFNVSCEEGFSTLPSNFYAESEDEDYQLNSLLYRKVQTYGIGHGCAATWDDGNGIPRKIVADVMPEYEVKPIIPSSSRAKLSMEVYSKDRIETISDLELLCNDYESWIKARESELASIPEVFYSTADKQIEKCKECLNRLRNGLKLLSSNDLVYEAFSIANQAMLLQQLHYKLPLTEYKEYNPKTFTYKLASPICMPNINDKSTWYNPEGKNVYGKWRPFQIAFILMNLDSISNKESKERKIVDLIWFPTGGGKTEAYLGLTAFTIVLRRLKNPEDAGTTVIMRYTLRLLTSQQYERAASLICALEKIRSQNPIKLGTKRISIGLWVGDLTDNNSDDVIKRIAKIQKGSETGNVSVILKCPWCGASMETFKTGSTAQTPGYEISPDKKQVLFRCANELCDFSDEEYTLPLELFDDQVYNDPPSLLFGTVDKFAMLPFKPIAKNIFGGDKKYSPPELIIQDELHLITGPLGSAVGLYETLIEEICKLNGSSPKVVASTATISHAKKQCNALYGCGENNVFQFPVPGLDYSDCFFANEAKNKVGRKYIGLYGSAASSSATASIFTFASLLYSARDIAVEEESKRDPYWTNLAYFGSMRELGQAATWYIADIKERLEVLYHNHLKTMDKENRRYIYESGLAELTSRKRNDEIPKILKRLEITYPGTNSKTESTTTFEKNPIDICLATNMVSVGVDISRLGLMTVTGQPKSTSEYIQATSRVGRDSNAPGLVFVIYNTSKPRDKSFYEKFQSLHSKLYYNVEPTTVTPFSRPLRDRALHAIFVGLHRFTTDEANRDNARIAPTNEEFERIKNIIVKRASLIDESEVEDIKEQLEEIWEQWKAWKPEKYSSFGKIGYEAPLLCQAGTIKPDQWEDRGWETPTSMRSVDRECGLDCSKTL